MHGAATWARKNKCNEKTLSTGGTGEFVSVFEILDQLLAFSERAINGCFFFVFFPAT